MKNKKKQVSTTINTYNKLTFIFISSWKRFQQKFIPNLKTWVTFKISRTNFTQILHKFYKSHTDTQILQFYIHQIKQEQTMKWIHNYNNNIPFFTNRVKQHQTTEWIQSYKSHIMCHEIMVKYEQQKKWE